MAQATTVVFGGGGVWGIAWLTGLVAGLSEGGVDLRVASTFIGTSAGSVVATQLCGPTAITDLYLNQADVTRQAQEIQVPNQSLEPLIKLMQQPFESREARVHTIGQLALSTADVSVVERRADIARRLGAATTWPAKRLVITAVDAISGELRGFDAASGVELVDAVAASCAVPGVWPTVTIQGRRYMDGGAWRTPENAHLARGAASVMVLSPFGGVMAGPSTPSPLDAEIAALRAEGAKVTLVCADPEALASVVLGALNPASRAPAAKAGKAQGLRVSALLKQAGEWV